MSDKAVGGIFREKQGLKCLLVLGVLFFAFILLFLLLTGGSDSDPAVPLIMVRVEQEDSIQKFYDAGFDLRQADRENGEIFLAMHSAERQFLEENGYEYEVLVQDINRTGTDKTDFNLISEGDERDAYRTWDDYVDEILAIEALYPDITKLHIIGYTHWGLPMYCLEITDAPGVYDGRPESFHEGQMHAQEWPSGEMAIELAWYLTNNYGDDERVTGIVENIRTWVMPVTNPDGVIYRHTIDGYWRKNRLDSGDGNFGVDLTRNFSYEWGLGGSPDPSHRREYHGPYAYSEPETRAYGDFLLSRDCITVLRGHTPGEVIFHRTPIQEDVDVYMGVLNDIYAMNNYPPRVSAVQGGHTGSHIYKLLRGMDICLEYQKEAIPPYEGYIAPGLETDAFPEMFKGNRIWNLPTVHAAEGQLVDCGDGLSADEYPPEVAGNIALIQGDGGHSLDAPFQMAQFLGAAAVIIYNNNDGFVRRPVIDGQVDIPAMVLRGEDGALLVDYLAGGQTINATIHPYAFMQDTLPDLWERNLPALLYAIEQAAVHAAVIEGSVADGISGEPLKARLDKKVVLTAPLVGLYEGEYLEHLHHSFIEIEGFYKWHVLPSKQPLLDTPPYEITVTAPGRYPQTAFLAVDHFGEEHHLDFVLQPVLELQGECASRSSWPVNSTVPFNFVTVDPRGRPANMENVTVRVFSGDTEIATFVEGNGPEDIRKGEDPGEYYLNGSTAGLAAGTYEVVVEFSGAEGEQSYLTELILVEELVLEGSELMTIPSAGQAEETYSAYTVDESGSLVAAPGVRWSLEQPVTGVAVDSASGLVTVESGAGAGSFTLTAEAGGVTGAKEVSLAGSELAAAITAAAEAIADLPGVVGLDDVTQVEGARALVDDVLALGGEENRIPHILKLVSAENKLAALEKGAAILDEAVTLAEEAIVALPETITLADRDAVEEARALTGRAFVLGAADSDIQNLDLLVAAEVLIEGVIQGFINSAETAIASLPEEITADDEPAVTEARALVNEALQAGIDEKDISNLSVLLEAEETIEELFDSLFIRESLFVLGHPGAANHNGGDNFLDYYNTERWRLDRTVGGVSFSPLKLFTSSPRMNVIGTPDNPRWIRYDISGREYAYLEGYLGIADQTPRTDCPIDFVIYVDEEPVLELLLEFGEAHYYRIDLQGAETIKFEYWTENTSEGGFANRPGFVEPQFLKPLSEEMLEAVAAAGEAIAALPPHASLLDEPAVKEARALLEEAMNLGMDEDSIENLDLLLAAEAAIEDFYGDYYLRENIFSLDDYAHSGMDQFLDYDNRWHLDFYTIAGVSYDPLRVFGMGLTMTTYGTPENPRWVEYDIDGLDYDWMEGYLGVPDQSGTTSYPVDFLIFVDGEPVVELLLEYGEPATCYRVDLRGAEKLKFQYSAAETSSSGFANRPGVVEPQFLKPQPEKASNDAREAIAALPADIAPSDGEQVIYARRLANNALALGVEPAVIDNLGVLEEAEATLAGFAEALEAAGAAVAAINDIPPAIDMFAESLIIDARSMVEEALAAGAELSYIDNIETLEKAESSLEELYKTLFDVESLFVLGDPGESNRDGMEQFIDYDNSDSWCLDSTIGGRSFAPLKMYVANLTMDDLGGAALPRRIEYDISGKNYAYVEGYAGVPDYSEHTDYPLDFVILVDGEPSFYALLEDGKEAYFYRLDLRGAAKIEFQYFTQSTGAGSYANRPGFVEPLFLIPQPGAAAVLAEEAIAALPDVVTPLNLCQVKCARRKVNNALGVGAKPAEIGNLSELEDAEAVLAEWAAREGTMQYALDLALTKIAGLPEDISIEDMYSVFEARGLADRALRSGAVPMLVTNLGELEEAEGALQLLMDICFAKDSLHELTPVDWQDGDLSEMSGRFANYQDTGSWNYDYTVYNRSYYPLKVYSRGHRDLDLQPQWIDYDISGKGYEYMEGYVGIWDESSAVSYPPTFRIYGEIDGRLEILFEVEELWRGEPPYHYFLDLTGVDRIRFYMESEVVSPNRWTNRIAIVEPQFLTAVDLSEIIALAEAAIAALPAPGDITSEDEAAVLEARSLVDSAIAMGAVEEDIANYDLLLAAEAALVDLPELLYGDINGDGVINVEDVIMVMQSVLGLIQLDETQQLAADVNGDEIINVEDVILIMQRVLGLISQFPVEN